MSRVLYNIPKIFLLHGVPAASKMHLFRKHETGKIRQISHQKLVSDGVGAFSEDVAGAADPGNFFAVPFILIDLFAILGWFWLLFGASLPFYLTGRLFRNALQCRPKKAETDEPEKA
jgi:hypothetical protein